MGKDSPEKVVYNYRYFLPHPPLWGSSEFCEKRFEELLNFCNDARIDALQFYVNTRPGTYYMPASSASEQKAWVEWMKGVVVPVLRGRGISYQLNFQMLLGAHSADLDMRDNYDWDFLVNQYGDQSLGCACPIGTKFRNTMGEMLRLWAGTEPDKIWIDDDFRMHNHGVKTPGGDCDFYCYCDNHLEAFAKFSGKYFTREELVNESLKPGVPSSLRLKWMDFLGDTMADTALWIRSEIHSVSPQTRIALMTSCPDVHSVEGRDWGKVLKALCGDYPPITRPCSGIYTGTTAPLKDQTVNYRYMSQSIQLVKEAFGNNGAEFAPELENTRFTTWCKSIRNSEYLLKLGQLLGCPEITLSMNDLDASPIEEEPGCRILLQKNKTGLQALADLTLRDWAHDGLVFISDAKAARKVQLAENAKVQDLGLIRHWEDFLLQMGIGAFYLSPEAAAVSGKIVVLERYTAWCLSDSELKTLLAGKVLLDGAAASVLQERGFGSYIGVEVVEKARYGIHAELYNPGILEGVDRIRVPHRGNNWYELDSCKGKIVSHFIDPLYRLHIGSCVYENESGGRVAVYAGIGDMTSNGSQGCQSHARLRWIHGIIRWLTKNNSFELPQIPHHGLTILRSNNEKRLLAFVNLGTDALEELSFYSAKELSTATVLDKAGNWQSQHLGGRSDHYTIQYHIEPFEWLIAVAELEMSRDRG